MTDEVLRTVLIKVESILNCRLLGYVSRDISDPDPVSPNSLLMGRLDSSLPQVVYPESETALSQEVGTYPSPSRSFLEVLHTALPTQAGQKWKTHKDDIIVGTVVLIVDQLTPRALWQVGTVKTVIPGADG